MNRFAEHEIKFFKRLRKAGKNVDPETLKFSIFLAFILVTLFVIPLINVLN